MFNGLGMNLGNLSRISESESRSISAENPTGGKGMGAMAEADPSGPARELGKGYKCRPCIIIKAGETASIADIPGEGVLESIWCTGQVGRDLILRIYWDGMKMPQVECPVTDFFAVPWISVPLDYVHRGPHAQISSLPVAVNPNRGMNCFWEMPFRKSCRITIENRGNFDRVFFYQINYILTKVTEDCAYFHARFRRENPLPIGKDYVIAENLEGPGQYVGTVMAVGINNAGWWGEGEVKFYIDGDDEYPTICGTGTEDYFGGAWDWNVDGNYTTYTTPFLGMHQVLKPDGLYDSQHRHAMYRWHIMDPVRFNKDLKVTIQALGWRSEHRYYPGQHDIASVAYWYQQKPARNFPPFPSQDTCEIIRYGS
jgi:hypothetical protein